MPARCQPHHLLWLQVSNKLFAEPASILKQVAAEGRLEGRGGADEATVMDVGAVQVGPRHRTPSLSGHARNLCVRCAPTCTSPVWPATSTRYTLLPLQGMARGVRSSEGQQAALELLQALADGYRLLCLYK